MRNKKRKTDVMICLSLLATVLIIGGLIIFALPENVVTNRAGTGAVDIELTQYIMVDGEEQKDNLGQLIVMPGTDISKISRISNNGNSCYVRAKVTFSGTDVDMEDTIYGITDDWIKRSDGYYYFKDILSSGGKVDFFQGLRISDDFPQSEKNRLISYAIEVEAIQSRNFSPDFTADSPWGAVEIRSYEAADNVKVVEAVDTQSLMVEYQGNVDRVIVSNDDFFTNFPALLPGDTYSDSVILSNDSKEEINIYFRSVPEKEEILDKVGIRISTTLNGKTTMVYEGALTDSCVTENLLLGTFSPGTLGVLDFTISVPDELDNDYAKLDSYVKWFFSTEPITDTDGANIQTGDNMDPAIWMINVTISFAVFVAFMGKTKKTGGKRNV